METEAIGFCSSSKIGAATALIPSSNSCSEIAKPRSRVLLIPSKKVVDTFLNCYFVYNVRKENENIQKCVENM